MINFRFHIVSLIAVFLALALGVVVGLATIEPAIVDGLKAQIDRVERNVDTQRDENQDLRSQLGEVRGLAEEMAAFTVRGDRLLEVPVVVLATRGVDEDAVRSLLDVLRREGAVAPAVLWLEGEWALEDREQRDALRELLSLERSSDAGELRAAAFRQLAGLAGGGPGVGAAGPAQSPGLSPGLLARLVETGFVEVDTAGGPDLDLTAFPGAGTRVVVISGTEAEVGAEVLFLPMVEAFAGASLLTLAADVSGPVSEGPEAPVVGLVRSDGALSDSVSTVDGADTLFGRVAAVLALEELGRGERGHYGTGPGAQRRLPEPAGT